MRRQRGSFGGVAQGGEDVKVVACEAKSQGSSEATIAATSDEDGLCYCSHAVESVIEGQRNSAAREDGDGLVHPRSFLIWS